MHKYFLFLTAYSKNCWHCCRRYLCPCCVARVYWKVTGQGVFYRKVPPCRQYFGTGKDLDLLFFILVILNFRNCFCKTYSTFFTK